MGGSVNVAIRLSDGRVFSGEAWTNNQPWLAQTMALSSDPDAILLEYIDKKINSTLALESPFYEGGDYIYPDGYGLVVYDVMTKTIFTMQTYSGFTNVTNFYEWLDHGNLDKDERQERDEFEGYYKEGRLYLYIMHRAEGERGRTFIGQERQDASSGLTFDEFLNLSREVVYRDAIPNTYAEMVLDLSPWTIEDYMRGFQEKRSMFKTRLLDAGFTLNLAAEKGWTRHAEGSGMIRRRFERALRSVWRFNAWYDDLTVRRMDQDRFIIFTSLMVIGMCLPPLLLFVIGLPYLVGQFFTVAFYSFLGLTRIYYMDYLQKE